MVCWTARCRGFEGPRRLAAIFLFEFSVQLGRGCDVGECAGRCGHCWGVNLKIHYSDTLQYSVDTLIGRIVWRCYTSMVLCWSWFFFTVKSHVLVFWGMWSVVAAKKVTRFHEYLHRLGIVLS